MTASQMVLPPCVGQSKTHYQIGLRAGFIEHAATAATFRDHTRIVDVIAGKLEGDIHLYQFRESLCT